MKLLSDVVAMLHNVSEKTGIAPELYESYAWQLLETVTQSKKAQLLANRHVVLSHDQEMWLCEAIKKLTLHEPLQYIVGEVLFLDCVIKVRQPLLIPRSETEEWVAQLIAHYKKLPLLPLRIVDIGTGTGCIAISLAKAFRGAAVIAVDVNPQALLLAQENAHLNKVLNVECILSDVYENTRDMTFDVIVSNPPYVRESDWLKLDPSVLEWEDKKAIVAPDEGLAIIKRIVDGARERLSVRGTLWIEIDAHQAVIVQQLFCDAGFVEVVVMQDLQGRDRVVWGRKE